jgi:hypothetical protein
VKLGRLFAVARRLHQDIGGLFAVGSGKHRVPPSSSGRSCTGSRGKIN